MLHLNTDQNNINYNSNKILHNQESSNYKKWSHVLMIIAQNGNPHELLWEKLISHFGKNILFHVPH